METILRTPARSDSQSLTIDPDCAYMINPGSSGQPRDGDPRAAYAIYDTGVNEVTYRRVAYDIAAAQKKIHERRAAANSGRQAVRGPLMHRS